MTDLYREVHSKNGKYVEMFDHALARFPEVTRESRALRLMPPRMCTHCKKWSKPDPDAYMDEWFVYTECDMNDNLFFLWLEHIVL